MVEERRSWAWKNGERKAAGRQEGEGGSRQRTQLGQRCGAGLGKDGVFKECEKLDVVAAEGTMEREEGRK